MKAEILIVHPVIYTHITPTKFLKYDLVLLPIPFASGLHDFKCGTVCSVRVISKSRRKMLTRHLIKQIVAVWQCSKLYGAWYVAKHLCRGGMLGAVTAA